MYLDPDSRVRDRVSVTGRVRASVRLRVRVSVRIRANVRVMITVIRISVKNEALLTSKSKHEIA